MGLAHFLHKVRVPSFDTGMCSCGQSTETPRHVLLYCPREEARRRELGPQGDRTFTRLLNTPRGAETTAKWAIRSGRLHQFGVANSLLYD
jgi:hypothetical protein